MLCLKRNFKYVRMPIHPFARFCPWLAAPSLAGRVLAFGCILLTPSAFGDWRISGWSSDGVIRSARLSAEGIFIRLGARSTSATGGNFSPTLPSVEHTLSSYSKGCPSQSVTTTAGDGPAVPVGIQMGGSAKVVWLEALAFEASRSGHARTVEHTRTCLNSVGITSADVAGHFPYSSSLKNWQVFSEAQNARNLPFAPTRATSSASPKTNALIGLRTWE